jgi:hypothetical protein
MRKRDGRPFTSVSRKSRNYEQEPRSDMLAKERASFLKINDISFFGMPGLSSLLFYSVSENANSIVFTKANFRPRFGIRG